jgi:hypothetical protein
MNILTVNLERKMVATNRRLNLARLSVLTQQSRLDNEIKKLDSPVMTDAAKVLRLDYKLAEAAQVNSETAALAHLPPDRVFTTEAIQKVCLMYGLRFLQTDLYKGELDAAIPAKLAEFKAINDGHLSYPCPRSHPDRKARVDCHFRIAAPTESFELQDRPKDPLLFARVGADHWYLVHKWGNDLSVWNRVKNWNWQAILIAAIITACVTFVATVAMSDRTHDAKFGATFLSVMAALISAIILGCNDQWFKRVTEDNWSSPFKS